MRATLMTAAGALALALLSPRATADDIGPGIYVAGAALDLVSTEYALAHGALEANPVMRGAPAKRMAIKAGLTAGVIFLDGKVKSKPAKWAIRAGWFLVHGYVAQRNFEIGRNGR